MRQILLTAIPSLCIGAVRWTRVDHAGAVEQDARCRDRDAKASHDPDSHRVGMGDRRAADRPVESPAEAERTRPRCGARFSCAVWRILRAVDAVELLCPRPGSRSAPWRIALATTRSRLWQRS